MCGDCFVCIYLVCQCDGLELGRRNRRITVRESRLGLTLRFSWEGVLNHTWISPWTQKGILLCEMDPRKRSVTYVFMNDETSV